MVPAPMHAGHEKRELNSVTDNLRRGDCAIVGVNTKDGASDQDEFAIVFFTDLVSNTLALTTNIGVGSDGELSYSGQPASQGFSSLSTTSSKSAGWVSLHYKIPTESSPGPIGYPGVLYISDMKLDDANGDQIIVYQSAQQADGSYKNVYLCALDTSGAWATNPTVPLANSESALPCGLENGDTAVSLPGTGNARYKNYKYSGSVSGTAAQLRASINNPNNWVRWGLPCSAF